MVDVIGPPHWQYHRIVIIQSSIPTLLLVLSTILTCLGYLFTDGYLAAFFLTTVLHVNNLEISRSSLYITV